jgi:hypothetical protein
MRKKYAGKGDQAALLALIGMLVVFAFIVGRGWQTLVSSYGAVVSLPIGVGMAVIAILLAYAVGSERTHHPRSKGPALAYFFFLFNISALGAVNAMFVMFQSTNVFREEVERSNEVIVSLRDIGAPAISTADYDRFRADISERWRNLRAELDNPQLCGQGATAALRITELQVVLPSFRPLAGGGRCDKVPALIAAYEKQITDLEKETPVYLAAKKKLELKKKIQVEAQSLLDEVNEIRKGLNGTFSMHTVKTKFFDVAERYGLVRQELAAAGVTGVDKVPMRIDVKSISALGDIGQVIPFIISRLGETSTYVYLFIALVLDLAVIAAFARVLRVGPPREDQERASTLRRV